LHRLHDLIHRADTHADPLPPQLPDPSGTEGHCVQVLRTYPYRRSGYPFAPYGERSIARAYHKALRRARSLIYVEDQYLWSEQIAELFARAPARRPDLRLIGVVRAPRRERSRRCRAEPGRRRAVATLTEAGGDRVAIWHRNAGTPIYVHAKVCVNDDT
jgi:phosphatidylserine/phosphatidylglycerophosphate/cardiolipin synthase-like enzyme